MLKKIGVAVVGIVVIIFGLYAGAKMAFPFLFMKPIGDSDNYWHVGHRVYYSSGGNWFALGYNEVKGAHYPSFESIGDYNAKDDRHAYALSKMIPEADVNSFVALKVLSPSGQEVWYQRPLSKDKNHVYHGTSVIEGADAKTFEIINEDFARDKHSLYILDFSKITKADSDPDSLVLLGHYFAKDNLYVYLTDKVITGADPDSFEFFESADPLIKNPEHAGLYSKDKNRVYYRGQVVLGADPKKFKVVYEKFTIEGGEANYQFGTDGLNCYKAEQKVDCTTFGN